MKKTAWLLTTVLLLSIVQHAPAQVITKYGDNVSTLDGIIKAYYQLVCVKKGGKVIYERDSLIHWPNARLGFVGGDKGGKRVFHYLTLKQFHQLADPEIEKTGFYEAEISRKVEQFGDIYHVFSTYESRNTPTSPVEARGINSIELFYDGTRFWILGWFFDTERKDNPIPAKYLDKKQ